MTRSTRNLLAFVPVIAVLVLASAGGALAEDVEVRLVNGDTSYGELVSSSTDEVVINRKVWTKTGLMEGRTSYRRDRVAQVTTVTSLEDLYQQRNKATPDTYDGQYSLARWCFERGLQEHAFTHAKRLWDQDPSDEVAGDLMKDLGYVLDDGHWLKNSEYASKHGLVTVGGKMLTPHQADLRKADFRAANDRDALLSKQHSLDSMVMIDEKRLAEAKAHLALLAKQQAAEKQQAQQQAQGSNANGGNRGRNNGTNGGAQVVVDTSEIDKAYDLRKKDVQKVLDSITKEVDAAHTAAAANKTDLDAAQSKADAAHQAFLDAMTPAGTSDAGAAASDSSDAKDGKSASPGTAAAPSGKTPAKDLSTTKPITGTAGDPSKPTVQPHPSPGSGGGGDPTTPAAP